MGFWSRLIGRSDQEERSGDGWGLGGWGLSSDGVYGGRPAVPVHLAESLSAVTACVELICGAVSSLPASLVIDTPGGRQPAPPSAAAWRILTRPNARQSWPAFVSWAAAQVLLHGNCVARVDCDQRGAPNGLTGIPWPWLLPQSLTGAQGPRLAFDIVHLAPESTLLGLGPRLLDSDVMHVRGRSDVGILGRSVLSRAGAVTHEALAIAELASSNWKNGVRSSGIISMQAPLKGEGLARLKEQLAEYKSHGGSQMGVLVLDGGATFTPMSLSSADAEFLASRAFSVAEICRLFSVPEPLMQLGPRVPADLSPYTAAFAMQALAPLVSALEAEFDHAVLPAGQHLQIDMSGLMRGSWSAAVSAMCATTQSGVTTANDARRSLGLPALDGGDVLRAGAPPSYPADFPGSTAMHPSPGPIGTGGVPNVDTNQDEGSA